MLFLATLLLAIPQARVAAQAPAATGTQATPTTEITPAPDAPRLELEFTELNDSGISGTATLSAVGDQTIVELQLQDTGENHPAHIHAGTCDDLQPELEFALANVRAEGVSSTVVDRPLQALIDGEFAIDVHLSPNELGTLVACVDIDGQPTVPASAGTPGPATPAVAGLATPTEVVVATETPFGSAASALATAVLRAATSAIMTVAAEGTTVPTPTTVPPTPSAVPPTPTAVPPTPTAVPATLTPTATVATAEPTVPPATPAPFTAIGRTAVRAATSAIQVAVALVVVDGASPQTPIPPQTAVVVEPTPTTGPAAVLTPPAATQPPQPGTVIDESTPVVDDGTGGAISTAAAETTPPPVAGTVTTPPAVAPTVVPPVAGAVAPTVPPTPQTPALGDGTQGGIDDSGKGVAITTPPVASAPIARDPGSSGASAPIVPAGVSGDGTQGDIADAGKGVPLSPTTGLPSAAGTGSSLDWPTSSSQSMPWLVGAMSVALLLAGAAIRATGSRRSRSRDLLR